MKRNPIRLYNKDAITVAQLRTWLEQFPDNGEIWVSLRGLSNPVKTVWELNNGSVIMELDDDAFREE